jgi:hypothetical protein
MRWWPGGVFAYPGGPLEADLVEARGRRSDATLRRRLRDLYLEAPGRRLEWWLAYGRVSASGAVVRRGDVPVGRDDRIELDRSAVAFPVSARARLAALGHPIVGDPACGSRRDPLGRVSMHATLGFHPDGRRAGSETLAPVSSRGREPSRLPPC